MKKWVTFDLDGTLMENPFGQWVFPEIERLVHEKSGVNMQVVKELVNEHNHRMLEGEYVAAYDWDQMLDSFLQKHNIDMEIDIENLVHKFSVSPKVFLLADDILPTLQKLRAQGYSLAAVTNGFYKYQLPVMKTLRLHEAFDEIITPCNTGYGKPDIRMITSLMQNDDQIVAHVGDRIDHDVYFANLIGTISIFIDYHMPEKVRKLKSVNRPKQGEYVKKLLANFDVPEELSGDHTPDAVVYSISEIFELISEA